MPEKGVEHLAMKTLLYPLEEWTAKGRKTRFDSVTWRTVKSGDTTFKNATKSEGPASCKHLAQKRDVFIPYFDLF